MNAAQKGRVGQEMLGRINGVFEVLPISKHPSVYFLLSENDIVYVGQSCEPERRVSAHRKSAAINFDSAIAVPVQGEFLNEVEGALIRHLRPSSNGRTPSKTDPDMMTAPPKTSTVPDEEVINISIGKDFLEIVETKE